MWLGWKELSAVTKQTTNKRIVHWTAKVDKIGPRKEENQRQVFKFVRKASAFFLTKGYIIACHFELPFFLLPLVYK